MPEETTTTQSTENKTEVKRAEQDQQMANDISAALATMTAARDDAEIQQALGERGYDVAAIDEAITTLQEPAQAAFNARQTAIGVLKRSNEGLAAMEAHERKDFADYREIARAAFTAAADRTELGLNGAAPKDLQKFITMARASYTAGKKAPFTEKLTKRGYSTAAIDAELAGIKGVEGLGTARAKAEGAAAKATKDRDAAFKALKEWSGEFRKVARRVLRDRTDLLTKLAL
jgi:hypothetical protein